MADVIGDSVTQLIGLVSGLPTLDADHTLAAYSEADLNEKAAIGIRTPFAGVMYAGIRSLPGTDPSRANRGADLQMTIMFGMTSKNIGNVDSQAAAWALMSAARSAIIGKRSPTGHVWRFYQEAFLGSRNDVLYYTQTWLAFMPIV